MKTYEKLPAGWYLELSVPSGISRLIAQRPGAAAVGLHVDPRSDGLVLHLKSLPMTASSCEAASNGALRLSLVKALLLVNGIPCFDIAAADPFLVKGDGSRFVYASIRETIYATSSIVASVHRNGHDLSDFSEDVETPLELLDSLANLDPVAHRVLMLTVAPDAGTWTGLYRLKEVIEDDIGGSKVMSQRMWVSGAQLTRFDRTANSPQASGDASRHGADRYEPPSNPMTLEEGRALVTKIVTSWLADRLRRSY